jgi:hypothetical protein
MEKTAKKVLTDWDKAFIQGYICAVVVNIVNHGMCTEVADLWKPQKMSIKELREAGVDEYDISVLQENWKELNH